MRDDGTEDASSAISAGLDTSGRPAVHAGGVVHLAVDADKIHSNKLPLWGRLERSERRGRTARWAPAIAWCVAIGLLLVALLRIFCHDAAVPLVWLNAFTFSIYLPAYAIALFAVWTRRWWLAVTSAAVVACHLVWVLPDFAPAATPPLADRAAAASPSRAIRIFYANVRGSNTNLDGMLAEARSVDPDVIVLAEMQYWWWHQLMDLDPLPDYPYGTNLQNRNAGDIGIFSRLPVGQLQQIVSENRVSLLVDISLGEQTLQLMALHSPRPTYFGIGDYYRFWRQMEPIIESIHGPFVVLGDFNATQHSLVYQRLKADGLRSAHEDRGRGYAVTWPNGHYPIPPIRIDQVFLSPEVECESIRAGVGPGSDHKPLILELRLRDRESGGLPR